MRWCVYVCVRAHLLCCCWAVLVSGGRTHKEWVQEDTVIVLVVSLLIVAVTTAALYAIAQWRPSLPVSSSSLTSSCDTSPAPDNTCTTPAYLQAT
jgi:hypothetical protein